MQREDGGTCPPLDGAAATAGCGALTRAAIAGYVQRLDRILVEARELGCQEALRDMARVPPPDGVPVGHLLERKRRELLGRFDRLRTRHVQVEVTDRLTWFRALGACAELAGCIEVVLAGETPSLPRQLPVAGPWPPELPTWLQAAAWLGFAAPHDRGEAFLDLATGWLTLAGPPMFVQEALRGLDRGCGHLPLDLHVPWDPRREWVEGSTQGLRIQLANLTDDVLIVSELACPGAAGLSEHLRRASLGRLGRSSTSGGYAYEAGAAGVTAPVFFSVVLRRGQTRALTWSLPTGEGGDGWRRLEARVARLSGADFCQRAYLPGPRAGLGSPAAIPYLPVTPRELEEAGDWSSVLIPEPEALPWTTQAWLLPVFVASRPFSLAQALGLIDKELPAVHYSRWQQAWVLADGHGTLLVAPDRVEAVPHVAPACYVVVDGPEQRVGLRVAERIVSRVREGLLAVQDWSSHPLGLPVHVPRAALPVLWRLAARMELRLTTTRDTLGRAILMLEA
ncbi:MAG: hypothetical protein VKQ33_13655 [Candidatus Sericytochromatia bacterium]|nr:hypothetical protein [Candidatus Sericytochromatia bacterium]